MRGDRCFVMSQYRCTRKYYCTPVVLCAPAAKMTLTSSQNIENVTRCRDNRMTNTVKCTNDPCKGLYTSLLSL